MTLCPDCLQADREMRLDLWPMYSPALCCRARSVANAPRVLMRAAFDAVTTGLDEAQGERVRARAVALIEAGRGGEGL